jgi:hypothetical protein
MRRRFNEGAGQVGNENRGNRALLGSNLRSATCGDARPPAVAGAPTLLLGKRGALAPWQCHGSNHRQTMISRNKTPLKARFASASAKTHFSSHTARGSAVAPLRTAERGGGLLTEQTGSSALLRRCPLWAEIFLAPIAQPDAEHLGDFLALRRAERFVEFHGPIAFAAAGSVLVGIPFGPC